MDANVGGHVEIGSDYESAAIQEVAEETGIKAMKDNLIFIQIKKSRSYDEATKTINNVIRAFYAYRYDGKIEDLRIEKGKAIGFEAWPLEKIFNISAVDRERFIPAIFKEEILNIFRKIQRL